jgi:hypothetical protein
VAINQALHRRQRDTLVAEAPPVEAAYVERNLKALVADGDPRAQARAPELLDWWQQAYRAISPYDVLDALRSGSVYPGTFLVMAYLGFYLGLQVFGGILPADVYHEYRNRPFRQEIMGCLGYLLDLARKSDEHGADGSS